MKSGASDPFADEDDPSEDENDETAEASTAVEEGTEATTSEDVDDAISELSRIDDEPTKSAGATGSSTADAGTRRDASVDGALTGGSAASNQDRESDMSADTQSTASAATDADDETTDSAGDEGFTRSELPYVLRRERVKDERPEVHQLFVQEGTHEAAVDAERALEDRLDEDLSRTDAREAIYLAGMDHLDEAEAILREWGYDL